MNPPLQLAALQDAATRPFVEAWLGWRGSALLPRFGQIDLDPIKPMLSTISLLERVAFDDVRFRLAGAGLARYLGFDPTGMNYRDLTPPAQWPVRRHRMDRMACHPCGGAMIQEETVDGKPLAVATITLPLLPDTVGGNPLLLALVMPLQGQGIAEAAPLAPVLRLPDAFSFVDIGAGAPASTEPA